MCTVRSLIFAFMLCAAGVSIANAATFTVSKTADTNDGTCDADCSLREAIVTANATGGSHTIAFNIPIGAGVAAITLGSALPPVTRNNVVIDGTTQTSNNGDTNPVTLGTGGSVGVDALSLSQVAGPEVEIRAGAVIANGLQIQANNVTVRGLAMLGFGAANGEGAIVIDNNFVGALIENNVLGSTASSFTDPGAALRNYAGVDARGGDDGTIRDNLIGFGHRGVFLTSGSTGWNVDGNEIRDHELGSTDGDGVAIDDSSDNSLTGNLITGSSSQGFVVTNSSLSDFVNNTVIGNGVGSTTAVNQSAGITMRSGASSTDLDRNIVHANYGAGIQINNGASGTRLTRNSFADNGTILARNSDPATGQIGIDLNAIGDDVDFGTAPFYTLNDAADGDAGGNGLRNFPILDTATIVGGNLTLTGWSQPGATIELFIAASDASGFGEGETYVGTFVEGVADADPSVTPYGPGLINGLAQGTDTTNRFSFTVAAPAGVIDGIELTATGTVGTDTSEFSGAVTVVALHDISGTVFEDVAGNVLDGAEVIGDAANPVVSGVDVYLYRDDGASPDIPDATDTIQNGGAPVATNGSGIFTFASIPDGTYWVVADSRTVSPAAGVHPSYLATTAWAEQTYGPDKGWCVDSLGSSGERAGAGPCYGGVAGAADDDASALMTSEHIARVVLSGGAVAGVDFGFSYNVVTNLEAAGVVSLTASTYQGSLDQFIRNANAINGANAMRFVPAVLTNASGGGGAWWRIDYTGSVIGETLSNTHDADTTIDGTAFDLVDGVAVRNTNPGNLGANAGGGVTVGVDDVPLPQVARPELEVMRSDAGVGVAFYFYSNATTGQTPNNFTVRNIAMSGFVGGVGMTGIAAMRPSGVVIERNVIGSPPDAFTDPAISGTLRGVALNSTDGATVRDNLIGFVDTNGVSASAVTGTAVSGNEIRETGQVDGISDGINYGGGSTTGTVTANLVVDSGGMGIDGTATGNVVANNTVTGSGQLGVQIGGIRQTGSGNTVRRNIVTGSAGPGVIVPDTVNAITVTENHFGGNGSIAIDLVEAAGDTAAGDGIMLNDGLVDGNDGNDGLDYPIIDGAVLSGGNLIVTGFARAGATIEFYEAVGAANDDNAAGNPHGEGVVYLFTSIEGVADADATIGASYTDPGYGADPSVNRFSFTVVAPAGIGNGDQLSAIAIDASSNTSEFSPNVIVSSDADLVTTKVLDASTPGPFQEGDSVSYLITVSNNGPSPASNVTATDTYPAELTLGVAVPSAPTSYVAATGVWTIGSLNAGESATLLLPGTVNAGTAGDVITNSMTAASGNEPDPTSAGDDLVETFTVLPVLNIDDVTQAETNAVPGTTTFTFTVSINQAIATDVTFEIDTADNTATVADTDYVAIAGGNGTILAGDTSTTIDVTVNGDNDIEADETFFVNLSNVVAAAVADGQGQGTISNDDSATVSIAGTLDANETGPVDGQFTVTQSTSSATDTVITYTVAGSATAGGTDYTTLSGSVTVLAGATTATIDVTGIVDDALVEGTETVIVTLTATDNPGVAVAGSPADTATVSIIDSDTANVSIASTTDGSEAGPVDGQFTVTQSVTSATDTVIAYNVAGSATAATDYTALTGTVTVLAGATTATIDVTGIVADALVEGTETVIVTLTATDNPGIAVAGSPADTATINIIDSDTANVSIAATTDGNESGPIDGVFTVTQSAVALNDTVISYTAAGTATSGSDYIALSGTVTIPGGATTATINVSVIDDALAEGVAETLDVTLGPITAGDPGISIAASPDDVATITIADNDADLVTTKTVNNATPSEGDSITYTIVVTNSAGVQATNISLTDTLPAGVAYVSDDSGGNYNNASGVWSIGTLDSAAPNNVATLNIMATVDSGASSLAQPITNTTTAAAGDQSDPDTSTDSLSANITVDANADLITTKIVDNASPFENSTIVYTISVFNNGTAQATNVGLIDLLPTGVTYVGDDSGGAYNPVTGAWTIGTIDNGTVAMLNITASVDTGAGALAQPITNLTTAATGDQLDPDTTTDDLSEDITINYNADLVTTKTVDNSAPLAGDTIVYTLSVTNNGPAPASTVSLADSLPFGVSYVSDDGAGTYDSVTGVWAVGDLANGANATLNISASVDSGAGFLPQPITNMTTAAAGDQLDPDTTTDDLVADINVSLLDPSLIQLTKTVGRNRANAGEIVTYSVEIRNTTANPIAAVRLSDTPARGFKYVTGTAQLDGLPMPDPIIGLPIDFDIGAVPGHVDSDGNGAVDPGEPGYRVISYRMVAGSGVAPGIWTNTAVATVACDTCYVSNAASADIEIVEDTLFDLGTLIGKVFYDADRDGFQDSGEAGIAAAMVALDDGSYVLTDEFGRYHFPAVKPGQRLLKINLNSLAGQATATNDKTRIVSVTPGLMAKANFGVIIETVDAAIGAPGEFGIGVASETNQPPILINGSALMPSLLVNGAPVSLGTADIVLGIHALEDVVELGNGELTEPIRFSTEINADATVEQWEIVVSGSQGQIVYTRKGIGAVPANLEWDGIRRNGRLIRGGGIYTYYLTLTTRDGQSLSSGRRLFGVNRRNSISLNLAGGAFVSGSHELTSQAKSLLADTAKAIRAYPDEIVVISGHTDSVGGDASNMLLAERRARSAYDYLHTVEGIPKDQFVIQAFGESRPIASNDTAWGRELNRRVEISGDLNSIDLAKNYDPYRQRPDVRIAGTDVDVDESGSFRTQIAIEDEQETMTVFLSTSQGRSVATEVQLPTLQILSPQGQFAIPIDDEIAVPVDLNEMPDKLVLSTELVAKTEPGNTVEFNGQPLDVDERGHFSTRVTLHAGENYYGLVARNPMGMLRIANLKMTVDDSSMAEPVVVVEPIPQLALQLPPPGIPMTNANLVIPGSTVPGNRVFINDKEISVDTDGSFTTTIELSFGDNPLIARVVDGDGYSGQIEQTLVYNGNPIFFMALVDGAFSKLQTSGNLEAAGKDKRDESVSEGRIAYYFKGHVLGKYLLTSAFDSGRQELGELFSDLSAQDNDRLLTNLDPETLYPVYGDSSTLVYDVQSQSKFYLALESDAVTALIGNYALNFTDTELAGYQRTLYGASATFQSQEKDAAGNSKTKAQAFHANIEQAHVRDELRATGGSLYYLSQRDIIEGSEHISVIVRDQDTGLILSRTVLLQGLDYSIDYFDGRLLTNRPISSFSPDTSLIERDLLGGSAVYLQIDYETMLDGFEQTASGARVRQGFGERLTVGATSVDEDQLGGKYSLKAGDAEYRLGRNSRLVAEYAASEGNNSLVNISEDGGLSYQPVMQAAGSRGDAYKIAAELDAGEWFGIDDRLLLNTYFRHLDTGFSANSVSSEQGSEKSGIGASWKINDSSSLLGRYERQVQLIDGSENTFGTLQWNLVRKTWGVAAEIEDRDGFAGDATIAALRMSYRWTDALSTSIEQQQTLDGLDNDQSTLGVAYRATDKLTVDASATHGTIGDSAQLGAQFDWRGNRVYVAQQLNDLPASGVTNNRLIGIEAPFGPDGAVYSEYHWSGLPSEQQQQTMIGVRQRFDATDGLQIEVSGEHSAENAISGNSGERFAISIGANFANDSGVKFSTRNEYRKDSRSISSEQFLSTTNLELALGNNVAALGKYRFSKSESSTQTNQDIDFTEASIGLAYRPVENDRLNLLARYSRLTNMPTEFQLADVMTGSSSDIFAVDWSYQFSQRIEWVGKQAFRWSEDDDDPFDLRSQTSLSIQRLNWSLPKKILLGTEYRLMSQDLADDRRSGFVTELMWEGLDPLRLGVGYNFSDVSDNEYVDYDFSTKGLFMRVQGKF